MTGHKPPSMQHRNAYQEIPHAPMFAPVTKFSARVDQAADLPRLMRQAWREAMTGTPRPAHLDLNGLQAEVIETGMVSEAPVAEPAFQLTMPPHRPVAVRRPKSNGPPNGSCAAKKVVIVAGEGATASAAGKELLALGELLAAPIATSLGGRGLIPTRHRCRLVAPATMPRRRRTRSCTRPNWSCSSAARPAIRSPTPGAFRRSIRRACRSTSIRPTSAVPIPTRWA